MIWLIVAAAWVLLIAAVTRANHIAHRQKMPKPGEKGKRR